MGDDVLTTRAINRATLDRQLLLSRRGLPVAKAIERTVALNAQEPNSPYIWLWTRLSSFGHEDLTKALEERTVVRSVLLRSTQHLVTAADFGWLRPTVAPLLERAQRNTFGRRVPGVSPLELVEATRELLTGRTMTRPELGRLLDERWPGLERSVLAWSAQYLEPMLHPVPSGTWNHRGAVPIVLATDWLGDLDEAGDAERLVRRYLTAYGPATGADIRAWSGVGGMPEALARMAPKLRTYTDESGRTLYDVPRAPRPSPDTPAPVRFLPAFDNLLLAYSDRSRVMSDEIRAQVCVGDAVAATVLVDGFVAATWTIEEGEVAVTPLAPISEEQNSEIRAEAVRLLEFIDSADRASRIDQDPGGAAEG